MAPTSYRYELRDGHATIATGHITYDAPLEIGDQVTLGKTPGVVRDLGPRLAGGEFRLVVQVRSADSPKTV